MLGFKVTIEKIILKSRVERNYLISLGYLGNFVALKIPRKTQIDIVRTVQSISLDQFKNLK